MKVRPPQIPIVSMKDRAVILRPGEDMRSVNDNAPFKSIEQARADLFDNVRVAIASIKALTEKLEKLQTIAKSRSPWLL